jgi:hypothetical protein
MSALKEWLACLTAPERAELDRLLRATPTPPKRRGWTPLPGPQSQAYDCPADILLYGGAAGGGKTDLLLGLALTRHARAILFRREFAQLKAVEDRAEAMIAGTGLYSASRHLWRLQGGKRLEFGAVQRPGDERKYQGRAHDLKAFDEITHFTEMQFRFLAGWNRAADPKQRCRIVAAGNPPTGAEGDWVIRYWAPWLDRQHANPARSGELRWFATLDGAEREVEGRDPIRHKGETIQPKSRAFIRARVEDNPYLMAAGYKATLQALPEPLRSQMLSGDFGAAQEDDPFQVVPTSWVLAAQARWTPGAPEAMTSLGVDVARGGRDRTVLTARHGAWFDHARTFAGEATPDGPSVLARCVAFMADAGGPVADGWGPVLHVDVIGVGASVYDAARGKDLDVVALNGAEASQARDRTGRLGFVNARAEWWWKLREALDPDWGEGLALPPDRELLADLTAPRWSLVSRGIQIEGKDEIRARIGRSPDKGDSLVYAHARPLRPGTGLLAFMAGEAARAS